MTPATPFTSDLSQVDRGGFEANLEFLVESGVGLIYPAGNTGEVMSLSPDEWTTVVETAVAVAGSRAKVLAGIGHEYPVARDLARRAAEIGVDGLLLMPRSQPYVSSAGLVAYWRSILDEAGLPGVAYVRGLPNEAELLDLVSEDRVVACKYADKDVSRFASVVGANTAEVVWTCGLAERYAPYYQGAGAVGFTSGLANFAPDIALEMHAALAAGDLDKANQVRGECLPFEEIRARGGDAFNVSAVKHAMDLVGLAGGGVRPPLVDLDERAREDVAGFVASRKKGAAA